MKGKRVELQNDLHLRSVFQSTKGSFLSVLRHFSSRTLQFFGDTPVKVTAHLEKTLKTWRNFVAALDTHRPSGYEEKKE